MRNECTKCAICWRNEYDIYIVQSWDVKDKSIQDLRLCEDQDSSGFNLFLFIGVNNITNDNIFGNIYTNLWTLFDIIVLLVWLYEILT